MDRKVTSLDFITRSGQSLHDTRGQFVSVSLSWHVDDLREARGSGPVRYEGQSLLGSEKFSIGLDSRARREILVQCLHESCCHRCLQIGHGLFTVWLRR